MLRRTALSAAMVLAQAGLLTCVSATLPPVARAAARLTPQAPGTTGGPPGFTVSFRKAAGGYFTDEADNVALAGALFEIPLDSSDVIAAAQDNGVLDINYLDTLTFAEGRPLFTPTRDVGVGPLTAVKTTTPAGNPNSGTFNPDAEDDDFAMLASGFVYFPQPGVWTISARTDDTEQLNMGADNQLILGGPDEVTRQTTTDSAQVSVPGAGPYHLQFLWAQGDGGALAELYAQGPGQASPQLLGDVDAGGLAVWQDDTPTTTSLSASANPVTTPSPVTFTAAVTPDAGTGSPTGTIQFADGSGPLGTPVALAAGRATLTAVLPAGAQTVTATYSGDGQNFSGSVSSPLTETVTTPPPPPTPPTPPPAPVDATILAAQATPLFATQTSPFGTHPLGELYSIDQLVGAADGERVVVRCTIACSRRLRETYIVGTRGHDKGELSLSPAYPLAGTTTIEIDLAQAGAIGRYTSYRFRRTALGVQAAVRTHGCLTAGGGKETCP